MKNHSDPDSPTHIVAITGCSRGLGRAMVDGFVERGDTVIGCARNADHIRELASAYPAPHAFRALDVSDDQAVASTSPAT